MSGSVRICINLLDFSFNARMGYYLHLGPLSGEIHSNSEAYKPKLSSHRSLRRKQFGQRMQSMHHEAKRITSKARASMRQMAVFDTDAYDSKNKLLVTQCGALLNDYVLSQGWIWFFIDLIVALIPAELIFTAAFHPNSEYLENLEWSVRARIVTNQSSNPFAPTIFLSLFLLLPAVAKAAKLLMT